VRQPICGGLVVIASNFGQQHHPAWYHNLLAHPAADLVVDGLRTVVEARLVDGELRERLWRRALAIYPGWDAYERRAAHREIGIFLLSPAPAATDGGSAAG
jgi:deazaflavin-dependent oxidoreductase (nitroreductase family)